MSILSRTGSERHTASRARSAAVALTIAVAAGEPALAHIIWSPLPLATTGVEQATPRPAPPEIVEYWESLTGTWIADNRQDQSTGDTVDAFGLQWTWGLNRKSLVGRLYGLKDGKEIGAFWEYRQFWHPAEQRLVTLQFGSDGTYGVGPTVLKPGGSSELVQSLYDPAEGIITKRGHRARLEGDVHTTTSFDVDEKGVWTERRTYVWRRQRDPAGDALSTRDAMSALEPFVGTWKGDPQESAAFVNYRLLEWDLDRTIVRFYEAPHPERRWRVASVIGWNPVEREIQEQAHADWGNFVRIRYRRIDGGFERRMTVYNGTDRKTHHWISTWRLLDADTFQSHAKEHAADGTLIQEWPISTYRRIERIPDSIIRRGETEAVGAIIPTGHSRSRLTRD